MKQTTSHKREGMTKLTAAAIHEAGHAVAAHYLGVDISFIEIIEDGVEGLVVLDPRSLSPPDWREKILISLAGTYALCRILAVSGNRDASWLEKYNVAYGCDEKIIEEVVLKQIKEDATFCGSEMTYENILEHVLDEANDRLEHLSRPGGGGRWGHEKTDRQDKKKSF